MPTQDFNATGTPQDIVAALGLDMGKTYTCQNVGAFQTLRVREAASAPDARASAFRVEASGHFTVKPDGANAIWVWTDDPAECPVVLTEAP